MKFNSAWRGLPGPVRFLRAIIEDIQDGYLVVVGLPRDYKAGIVQWVGEGVKLRNLGTWSIVELEDSRVISPDNVVDNRPDEVTWVDAADEVAARSWIEYINDVAGMDRVFRLCVAMDADKARICVEDKRLRKRMWFDFVAWTDSRAIAEVSCKRRGYGYVATELMCALVSRLARANLSEAERMARCDLSDLLDTQKYCPTDIWSAQVGVLFPLVDEERRRFIDRYRDRWMLPYEPNNRPKVYDPTGLEVSDMLGQLDLPNSKLRISASEVERLRWLRGVRNHLAHCQVVSFETLTLPVASKINGFAEIADFMR